MGASAMIRPDKRQRDRARALRKNLTEAERALWQEIRGKQLGAKFRRQAPIGPYIADFLSHDAKLVIEVDGGQHGETKEYDTRRTAFIEEQGYKVLRFWNNEILENMEGVLVTIEDMLRQSFSGADLPPPDLPPLAGGGKRDIPPKHKIPSTRDAAALPPTHTLHRAGQWSGAYDLVTLTYDDRFLRRKVLTTARGERFLVDLPQTTSLNHGDAFELTDGRLIKVIAAEEPLIEITGPNLTRLAWHIGNRHTPCQIEPDRLLIQHDHVIRDMLAQLGATLRDISAPFTPEGGAYGHGRTHGHAH